MQFYGHIIYVVLFKLTREQRERGGERVCVREKGRVKMGLSSLIQLQQLKNTRWLSEKNHPKRTIFFSDKTIIYIHYTHRT